MLYVLDMGATEQSIAKQAIRTGQPIPDRILNAPKLRFGLSLYFDAFFDLDAARQQGFSLCRIPWQVIVQYAAFYELDDEQTDCLIYFIKAMDAAYLKRNRDANTD